MKKISQLKYLIVDDNFLISKSLQNVLLNCLKLNKTNITILPNQNLATKNDVSAFLRDHAHKYIVILNANCSFLERNRNMSNEGIHLLQMIYENTLEHDSSQKPIIISFQSLYNLRNYSDSLCRILLEDEKLFHFNQLPFRINNILDSLY